MKVWLSRSRPGADRQADDLRQAGYEAVVAPVIDVQAVNAAIPDGPFDDVIFLSEHAVRFGLAPLRGCRWFDAASVVAVGARTGAVLADEGVHATYAPRATSEGLLELPRMAQPRGRRILLAAGEGGRGLLGEELTSRGADVRRFECYRRVPVARLEAEVVDCDVIIAASGDGLRRAAALWLDAGGHPGVAVLVPSARVAELGVEVGLGNLHDCGGADSQAWRRGLARLQSAENR